MQIFCVESQKSQYNELTYTREPQVNNEQTRPRRVDLVNRQ